MNIFFQNILDISDSQPLKDDLVEQARAKRTKIDKSWINQEPVIFNSVDSINLESKRFIVDIKSICYQCLFLPNANSDTLFVSLSGGGRTPQKRWPVFLRWKYASILNANMLCIDDPMYNGNECIGVRWYYGTKDTSYLKEMVPIITKIAKDLNIPKENIYFLGSSGGGYAANYMANIMDGTNAISMNPQFLLKSWHGGVYCEPMKKYHGVDIAGDDIHNRNNLIIKSNSVFFEIINAKSNADLEQFTHFCNVNNLQLRYGITSCRNVISWVHNTEGVNRHSTNPGNLGVVIAHSLIKHFRKHHSVTEFYNMSLILNEELQQKYDLHTKLSLSSFWKKALDKIYYLLPDNIIQSSDLSKSFVSYYFKSLIRNNIYNVYYTLYTVSDSDDEVKAVFGFCVVKAAHLVNNPDFLTFMKKIAKANGLHMGKNSTAIKLRATCKNVNEAVEKLMVLIERTHQEIILNLKEFDIKNA